MCGIAGQVAFDRDLTREHATIAAMTDTLRPRGPDGRGLWLARHAALGNHRLAVIDPGGGHLPMAAEGRAAITYSGEVYNAGELRTELEAKGHRFRTRTDTEVVLRGFLEWGAGVAGRLNGMYAFAVWDERDQELLLVRDRLGVKPLYYHPLPTGVLFASEPKAVLASSLVEPAVDADGLCVALTRVKAPDRTCFAGLYELRPGHLLRVRAEGLSVSRYWTLEAREHTDDLDTTIGTVGDLLADAVGRQLVADVPVCTLLSGGLDSSTVTALARRHGPVRSFAVDFAGYARAFRPTPPRSDPDTPFVHEVAGRLGLDHTDVVLDPAALAGAGHRARVVRAMDGPVSTGDLGLSAYLLYREVARHCTVALSGEAADEVFGGYRWFHEPSAVDAGTFPWLAARPPSTPADLIDKDLLKRLDLGSHLADRYRAALAEVPRLPGEDGRERRMREVCHLYLTHYLPRLLDRKDRLSMASGLEVRVPFCDHRLVEYVFNVPWTMKTFDGREKSLLRAAASGLLPRSVLQRRKSPYPAVQDLGYERALRAAVHALAADPAAPVRPLLDQDAVRAVTGSPLEITSPATRAGLETVLDLNTWLATYDLRC